MKSLPRIACVLAAAGALCAAATPARATFHEWRIDEVYSNASGTVQFVEFQQASSVFDDERFVGGQTLTSNAHSFTFPANLPSAPVANQFFLVATTGYGAIPGLPAADYTVPNNFFSTSGDTLTYAGFVDALTFTSAQLPTDGVHSLDRTSYGSATVTTAVNSPTNFAGATGVVPEPTAAMGLTLVGLVSLLRRRAR